MLRSSLPKSCLLPLLALSLIVSGCTSLIIKPIFEPLSASLQQQEDLDLLKEGAPSLLLMMDGLLSSDPQNLALLLDTTKAYSSYAAALDGFGETERAATVSNRAREYGLRLLNCLPPLEGQLNAPLDQLGKALTEIDDDQIAPLFWGAYGWATWISMQNGAPQAVADLPRVERIMLRVLELDDTYHFGAPHVFLGYYYGSIPAMYGGKPAESRKHFERALEISQRRFLAAQVAYAESYAKLQFDRELFERLLGEVLATPLDALPELTASNQMAKMRARKLLATIDDFF